MFKSISRFFRRPRAGAAGHVYYARLKTTQGTFYKIGFTTKSTLFERMAYGGLGDEKLIDQEFFFSFRDDAWDVEQTLLDHFDEQRAFGKYSNDPAMPLCRRGQSELFGYDVLGLDHDLYKQQDSDAVAATKDELENAKDGCGLVLLACVAAPFTLGLSLFFLYGGVSTIFSLGEGKKSRWQPGMRPVHSPHVRELVDALSSS